MNPKDQYGNRSRTDRQTVTVFSPCDFHGVMDKTGCCLYSSFWITRMMQTTAGGVSTLAK